MITSIFLGLYLLGLISAKSAAVFLVICGVLMIASEFFFPSGIVAFSGLLALYIAFSLEYGQSQIFGAPIGWGIFFGVALVEGLILGGFVFLILRYRKKKATGGTEGMIGHAAEVVEWAGTKGRVRVMGEVWKATSETPLTLKADDKVTVESIVVE